MRACHRQQNKYNTTETTLSWQHCLSSYACGSLCDMTLRCCFWLPCNVCIHWPKTSLAYSMVLKRHCVEMFPAMTLSPATCFTVVVLRNNDEQGSHTRKFTSGNIRGRDKTTWLVLHNNLFMWAPATVPAPLMLSTVDYSSTGLPSKLKNYLKWVPID